MARGRVCGARRRRAPRGGSVHAGRAAADCRGSGPFRRRQAAVRPGARRPVGWYAWKAGNHGCPLSTRTTQQAVERLAGRLLAYGGTAHCRGNPRRLALHEPIPHAAPAAASPRILARAPPPPLTSQPKPAFSGPRPPPPRRPPPP
ncbi:hypothetical protein BU225_20170, partial [Stenotrophomonas sp. MB339]